MKSHKNKKKINKNSKKINSKLKKAGANNELKKSNIIAKSFKNKLPREIIKNFIKIAKIIKNDNDIRIAAIIK